MSRPRPRVYFEAVNTVDYVQTGAIVLASLLALLTYRDARRSRWIAVEAHALEQIADRIGDVAFEAEQARYGSDKRPFGAAQRRLHSAIYFTAYELPLTNRLIDAGEDLAADTLSQSASNEIAELLAALRRRKGFLGRGASTK